MTKQTAKATAGELIERLKKLGIFKETGYRLSPPFGKRISQRDLWPCMRNKLGGAK